MAAPSLLDLAVIAADRVLKTLAGQHRARTRLARSSRFPVRRSRKHSAHTRPD